MMVWYFYLLTSQLASMCWNFSETSQKIGFNMFLGFVFFQQVTTRSQPNFPPSPVLKAIFQHRKKDLPNPLLKHSFTSINPRLFFSTYPGTTGTLTVVLCAPLFMVHLSACYSCISSNRYCNPYFHISIFTINIEDNKDTTVKDNIWLVVSTWFMPCLREDMQKDIHIRKA